MTYRERESFGLLVVGFLQQLTHQPSACLDSWVLGFVAFDRPYHFWDVVLGHQTNEHLEVLVREVVTQQMGFLKTVTLDESHDVTYHVAIELQQDGDVKLDESGQLVLNRNQLQLVVWQRVDDVFQLFELLLERDLLAVVDPANIFLNVIRQFAERPWSRQLRQRRRR